MNANIQAIACGEAFYLKAQIRDVGKANKTLSVVPGRRRILRRKEHPF